MKGNKNYLLLFPTVFLLCILFLSACSKVYTKSQSEEQIIPLQYSFARFTLGDTVAASPTISYGVVLEKSEYAEVPDTLDFLSPDEIAGAHYHRKVTMQVKKDIKNCKEGDIITYWEAGGKTKDGRIYVNEGNVSIPKDFMIEEKYSELTDIPEPNPKDLNAELPLEKYLDKVEKVVREQEAAG